MGDSGGLNEKHGEEAGCGVVGLTEKKEGYEGERNREYRVSLDIFG